MSLFKNILIRILFRKYRNTLPETSEIPNPKMEYMGSVGAVIWDDEGLTEAHPDLQAAFSHVIQYRTNLITGETHTNNKSKRYFTLAKKYFPNWIGFDPSRCSYNAERAERIKRLKRVSDWEIDKIIKDGLEYPN